jgi:superfamily II DNA or RNA helicase
MTGLTKALATVLPDYEIPDDDLVGEVLIPALTAAEEVRIGVGFFSSRCLAQVAPGLAALIASGGCPLRLLASPEISDEDRDAIERGIRTPQEVINEAIQRLLEEARLSDSVLVHHTLECLAYLIAANRLEIRFVLMQRGMYHKKKWLFRDGDTWAAVHGSGNATSRGLLLNGEQMTVDRPWMDGHSSQVRVRRLVRQWERQWNNEHPHSLTLEASQGLKFAGRHGGDDRVPTVADFWDAWRRDHAAGLEPGLPPNVTSAPRHLLAIPTGLEWRSGPYRHQGQAVDLFLNAGGRGVLAIATGGGKTPTSLIAAVELQRPHDGPMLVVVLVPSRPLMLQWADDVRDFGVEPFLPSLLDAAARRTRLEEIEIALNLGGPRTEVMVVTNDLFVGDDSVRGLLDRLTPEVQVLLIGDEMHNLGAPTALTILPERADCRLGLSATPIRQYDPDGTDRLFDYFGPQVFEFGLGDAISAGCLSPYRYHLHEVELSHAEMDKWVELTEELRKAGFRVDDRGQTIISNAKVERLLRERRAVLEQAEAKLWELRRLLVDIGPKRVQRCLIYTSAKASILDHTRQIERVNALLSELGIVAHQFTSAETPRANAQQLLDAFGAGDYQVLTAMKVLDEGIDIPQTDTAFLLASSTVRREWVQRRGRILRKAPGKTTASLHDFLVVPPNPGADEGRAVLKGEIRRAEEFASLATNEWDRDGPRAIISRYEEAVWSGGDGP